MWMTPILLSKPPDAFALVLKQYLAMVKWPRQNNLEMNPDKIEIMTAGKAGALHSLIMNGIQMAFAEHVKNLEVFMDISLLFSKQADGTVETNFYKLKLVC